MKSMTFGEFCAMPEVQKHISMSGNSRMVMFGGSATVQPIMVSGVDVAFLIYRSFQAPIVPASEYTY